MKLSKTSVALLIIQLALASSIAAKYLHQRWTCPRVWTRTVAYDPSLLMHGRYLALKLTVDGCQSTLPSAKQAVFPRDINGVAGGNTFSLIPSRPVQFPAQLKVDGGKLIAIRIPDTDARFTGIVVEAMPGSPCESLHLGEPVYFYIAEHAASPVPVKQGQELWIEATIPPKGPPRPLQLAIKEGDAWRPLAFQ